MSLQLSSQTFYWFVIGVLVLILATWTMSMAVKINTLYDDVDAMNTDPINYMVAGTRAHPLVHTTNTSH